MRRRDTERKIPLVGGGGYIPANYTTMCRMERERFMLAMSTMIHKNKGKCMPTKKNSSFFKVVTMCDIVSHMLHHHRPKFLLPVC